MSGSADSVAGRELAGLLASATALHRQGQAGQAAALYQRILALDPRNFDALHLLGVIHLQRGDAARAAELIQAALRIDPMQAAAHSSLGSALRALGRFEQALACFDQALRLQPVYPEAHNNLGNTLRAMGRYADALASYEMALRLRPDFFEAARNGGNVLLKLGQNDRALYLFEQALKNHPSAPDLLLGRSNALWALGRLEQALAGYEQLLALQPDAVEAWRCHGGVLLAMQHPGRALASFEQALKRQPQSPDSLLGMGNALRALRRYAEAATCFQRVIEVAPHTEYAASGMFHSRRYACDWTGHESARQRFIADVVAGRELDAPFWFLAISDSPAEQLACARRFTARHYPPSATPLWRGERYEHPRIRLAYLSADLHDHATAQLMAGLFERHDRDRFEVTAVSFGPDRQDVMRGRLRAAFEHFIDVRNRSDAEIAALLREREIDIAIDLKGYTTDCRPGILAHRVAPIQVSYMGFPGTMGADFIDYLIADGVVIPPGEECFYSEQVVRLPDSYFVNDDRRPIAGDCPPRSEWGLPDGAFVFCCFNNNYKITPDVFDVWMRILRETEGSVLWLFEDNPAAAANLRREAAARGVAPERLVFAPRVASDVHLARHRHADLFLDTLPYNAHTTACDALWAGLPVLTCPGATFVSRVAASVLKALDMPELIVPDPVQFIATARRLAQDPAELASLRARIAARRATHPLFDTDRFRRHFERAFTTMWERQQRGEPPASFDVPAIAGPAGSPA